MRKFGRLTANEERIQHKELIANASHELRTPLTVINTNISILRSLEDELSEESKKWIDSIAVQAQRMSALVTEMLELARLDNAINKSQFELVNLSNLVKSAVLSMEGVALEKQVMVEHDLIRPNIHILGVHSSIERLVYILIDNAIKYANAEGVVTATVKAEKGRAVLKVRNTGDGIDEEKLPHLFERFYRADEAHGINVGGESGFGLGLSIAKVIVDTHRAVISVDSVKNQYTEFTVQFKLIKDKKSKDDDNHFVRIRTRKSSDGC